MQYEEAMRILDALVEGKVQFVVNKGERLGYEGKDLYEYANSELKEDGVSEELRNHWLIDELNLI